MQNLIFLYRKSYSSFSHNIKEIELALDRRLKLYDSKIAEEKSNVSNYKTLIKGLKRQPLVKYDYNLYGQYGIWLEYPLDDENKLVILIRRNVINATFYYDNNERKGKTRAFKLTDIGRLNNYIEDIYSER